MIKEATKTLKVAAPLIVANLLQMSVATIDTVMAGLQKDDGLTQAAISLGSSLWQVCLLGMIGICLPLSPLFAHSFVSKNNDLLREKFSSAFRLCIFLGIISFLLAFLMPNIMPLLSVEEEIIGPATNYIYIMSFALPVISVGLAPRFLCEGMTNNKVLMYLMLLAIPINIIGNYIFLNGIFGLPKLGAAGMAIASLISIIVMTTAMLFYIGKSKKTSYLKLFSDMPRPSAVLIKDFLKLGIPVSIALLMEHGLFSAIVLFSGKMGKDIAAANQIALNYISLMFMVPLGISMAISARVGSAAVKFNTKELRGIAFSALTLGVGFMFFSALIILLFAPSITTLYSDNKSIITIASSLLFFAAIFQISDAIQVIMAGCLRGLRDTKIPTLYAFFGYWLVGLPLAYYLGFYTNLGPSGFWIALAVGLTITAILNTKRFWYITKERSKT